MTVPPPDSKTLHQLMRALPSMSAVLDAVESPSAAGLDPETATLCAALAAQTPRPLLREAIEDFLDTQRAAIRQGLIQDKNALALEKLLPGLTRHAAAKASPHLRRVINATGVIIHTNLGRSLLADEAVAAVTEAARGYSNLEFDLETGERGSRQSHVEELLCRLTGAEAALAVNNNAAAVLLALSSLCRGREVVVSRGELVEIGGSFRIPAVMEKSGCILREVGATNRTHLADYAEAITEHTAALLKVHTSNYKIIGFTKEVSREELAVLAKEKGLPLIEDMGSGLLLDLAALGVYALTGEPPVRQALGAGVDVVTFSGDKVLGGPQAGLLAGKAEYIERIRKNQLHRAMRIDKLTLAALEATLRLYTDPNLAKARIPTLRMLCTSKDELHQKARELAALLPRASDISVSLRESESRVGGGAFPEAGLPTFVVCLAHRSMPPDALQKKLLQNDPPVLARVEHDCLCFDPRTLQNGEFPEVAACVGKALETIDN